MLTSVRIIASFTFCLNFAIYNMVCNFQLLRMPALQQGSMVPVKVLNAEASLCPRDRKCLFIKQK